MGMHQAEGALSHRPDQERRAASPEQTVAIIAVTCLSTAGPNDQVPLPFGRQRRPIGDPIDNRAAYAKPGELRECVPVSAPRIRF
jgi:hypothetical protein